MGEAIKTRRGSIDAGDTGDMWLYKEGEEDIDNSGGWVGVEEGAGASCATELTKE